MLGDEDTKKEVKDKRKYVNMRYQIPTHFHGDIDNAVIFHCMENPRGYLGDWEDNQIDEEFAGASLEEFYIKSAIKREEKSETIKDIIKERYQLTESEQKEDFKEKITEIIYICQPSRNVEIIEGHLMPVHVHMLVSIPPRISVASFMGYLKGKSSLMMFDKHANLKYKFGNRHFWAEGYYVSTVGLNEATIKKYIQEQEKHDIALDKLSVKEYEDPFRDSGK